MIHTNLAWFSSTEDVTLLHFSRHFFNERAFMRCEFRQGVLQRDLWARRSVSNPGVSISMVLAPHQALKN